MIPSLTYQRAKDRRAELLRGAEEYRRAGLTGLMRITARIPRFPTRSHRSRAGVVGPSTPGLRAGLHSEPQELEQVGIVPTPAPRTSVGGGT